MHVPDQTQYSGHDAINSNRRKTQHALDGLVQYRPSHMMMVPNSLDEVAPTRIDERLQQPWLESGSSTSMTCGSGGGLIPNETQNASGPRYVLPHQVRTPSFTPNEINSNLRQHPLLTVASLRSQSTAELPNEDYASHTSDMFRDQCDSGLDYPEHPQQHKPTETIDYTNMSAVFGYIVRKLMCLTSDPITQILQTLILRMIPDRRGRYCYQKGKVPNDDGGPSWFMKNPAGVPWSPGPARMQTLQSSQVIAYIFLMPHYDSEEADKLMANPKAVPPSLLDGCDTPWLKTLKHWLAPPWTVPYLTTNYNRKKNAKASDLLPSESGKARGNTTHSEVAARLYVIEQQLIIAGDVERIHNNMNDKGFTRDLGPLPEHLRKLIREEPYGAKDGGCKRKTRTLSREQLTAGDHTSSESPKPRRKPSLTKRVASQRTNRVRQPARSHSGPSRPSNPAVGTSKSSTKAKSRYPQEPAQKKPKVEDIKAFYIPNDQHTQEENMFQEDEEKTEFDDEESMNCVSPLNVYEDDVEDGQTPSFRSTTSDSRMSTGSDITCYSADEEFPTTIPEQYNPHQQYAVSLMNQLGTNPQAMPGNDLQLFAPAGYGPIGNSSYPLPSSFFQDVPQPQLNLSPDMVLDPAHLPQCATAQLGIRWKCPYGENQQWAVFLRSGGQIWVGNNEREHYVGHCNCLTYVMNNREAFERFIDYGPSEDKPA